MDGGIARARGLDFSPSGLVVLVLAEALENLLGALLYRMATDTLEWIRKKLR